jgi:hypothetical protein
MSLDYSLACKLITEPHRGAANPLILPEAARDHQTNEEKYWLGLETVRDLII